jgi:hypothetical protein
MMVVMLGYKIYMVDDAHRSFKPRMEKAKFKLLNRKISQPAY